MKAFVLLAIILMVGPASAVELNSSQPQESVSYMIAFLAGVISVLSPCSVPLLLGYLAIMSKEKKGFWPKTFAFFLGLSAVWVLLGVSASGLGGFVSSNVILLQQVAGLLILAFGLMHLFEFSLPSIRITRRVDTTMIDMLIFGALFTLAWIPCVGPILGGILAIAATVNAAEGAFLLLLYAMGFMISVIALFMLLKRGAGKMHLGGVTIFGQKVAWANIIGGIFLIVIGLIYLFNQLGALDALFSPLADLGFSLEMAIVANPIATGVVTLGILLVVLFLASRSKECST